jgi:hypothetical protein
VVPESHGAHSCVFSSAKIKFTWIKIRANRIIRSNIEQKLSVKQTRNCLESPYLAITDAAQSRQSLVTSRRASAQNAQLTERHCCSGLPVSK